jgi:hypothetical protein
VATTTKRSNNGERISARLFLRSYRPQTKSFKIYIYSRKLLMSVTREKVDSLSGFNETEKARLLIAMDRMEERHEKRMALKNDTEQQALVAAQNRRFKGLSRALKGLSGDERQKVMSTMKITEADVRLLEANNLPA